LVRYSSDVEKTCLALGSLRAVAAKDDLEEYFEKELADGSISVYNSATKAQVAMKLALRERGGLALRHDFSFFSKNELKSRFAKPLLIDQSD